MPSPSTHGNTTANSAVSRPKPSRVGGRTPDHLGNTLEATITGLIAQGAIEAFEVVDVDQEHRHDGMLGLGFAKEGIEAATARKPYQTICRRELPLDLAELGLGLFLRVAFVPGVQFDRGQRVSLENSPSKIAAADPPKATAPQAGRG